MLKTKTLLATLALGIAFICSAWAAEAPRAIAAPSASVASMVLVVGMVLSLLTSSDGVSFKTMRFRVYSRERA